MKRIIILALVFSCFGCDTNTSRLVLINNTNNIIYYRLSTDTILYTDVSKWLYRMYAFDTVKPNFGVVGINNYDGWDYKINHESPDSTLHIFIFPSKEITKEVIKNKSYVRLDFKVKDLDSLKWTVVYEGDPNLPDDEE